MVTPQELEKKIEETAESFMTDHTVSELQAMHLHAFGVASKMKDKDKLAKKLARWTIEGNGAPDLTEPPDEPRDPAKDEVIARQALSRIKGAWDEHEKLQEEKRTALAEMRQRIGKSRDAIAETMKNATLDEKTKLARLEGHWSSLVRTEQKQAEIKADFSERIKASKQTVKSEFDNAKQLTLF